MRILLLLLALMPGLCGAVNFEIGAGQSRYNATENGLWYQRGYPADMDMKSSAVEAGIVIPLSYVDIHADAFDLGQINTNAYADPSDARYDSGQRIPLSQLSDFNGHGGVYGLTISGEPHFTVGALTFGVEVGAAYESATWTEHIGHWYNPGVTRPGFYEAVSVAHAARWTWSGFLGARVSWRSWSLEYRYYNIPTTTDRFPAIFGNLSSNGQIEGGANVLMLVYSF